MSLLTGFILVLVSGVMAGSALSPIKFVRKYRFENYWLIDSLTGTVAIPWALALIVTPHLFSVYSQLPWKVLLLPPAFAFSWGIASMLGGLCVSRSVSRSAMPWSLGLAHPPVRWCRYCISLRKLCTHAAGHSILLGIAVMLGGLVLVGLAGQRKESQSVAERDVSGSPEARTESKERSYIGWVLVAVLAGILSAGLNFSFAFGQGVAEAAHAAGASATNATYAVWALAMLGGMTPNLVYPFLLCFRNRSWGIFLTAPKSDIGLSVLLGVLFMGSTVLYGLGAVRLGLLGTSIGWGIMQIMQIVVGNLSGFLTGEWKQAGAKTVRLMLAGVAILVAASVIMAYGNYIHAN